MNLQDLLMGQMNERVRSRTRDRAGQTTTTSRSISTRPGFSRSSPSRGASPRAEDPAVSFGRSFTGGAGPGADAVDRLSRDVFSRLSQKGLYKDPNGTWQIRGMERPDATRQIRDSAVSAMGGPEWTSLVGQADSRANGPASSGLSTPARPGSLQGLASGPQPGLSSGPSTPTPQTTGTLSGLGSQIAGQVKSSIGQMPSGSDMAAGIQSKVPTASSIQSVVEASLRSRGATPPTSGPMAKPSTSGPQVGGMPGNAPGGTMARPPMVTNGNINPGQGPSTPGGTVAQPPMVTNGNINPGQGPSTPGGTVTPDWPNPNAAPGTTPPLPSQGQGQGQDLLTPKPSVTMYPSPAAREGTASTTAPITQTPVQSAGYSDSRMGIAAPAPSGGSSMDASLSAAANNIILQESGGAQWSPNNVNCSIRPESGCLDLNTGIFQKTAESWGLDWNRLMTDPSYAPQAVGQLLTNYANQPAGNGQTVWEYGEANLPGGGLEAVGRYYFGGCVTNGCFVDEQGRSVDTYGQQFVAKMGSAATPGTTTPYVGQTVQNTGMTGAMPYSKQDIVNPNSGVGAPVGMIPTDLNLAYGRGDDWQQVNQYDALFTQYGNQYGVDPAVLKSIAVVETGGRMIPNENGNAWSGMMQIDSTVWGTQAAQMGFDLNTPEGQVGFAAAMLGGAVPGVTGNNWRERFVNNYYPTGCMDCMGADGGTPNQYLADIDRLTSIIYGASQGGGMAPAPAPAPTQATGQPTLGSMGVTNPNGTLSNASLNSLGVGTAPAQQPASSGGNYPDVYGSGSANQTSYNPGAGPAVQLDPNTGKMVPVSGQSTTMNVAAPAASGGAPIASTPPQYTDMVNASATKYGVPANILSALIETESGWDPNAHNDSSGASGLGQCIGSTCTELGVTNPYDPSQAIDGAAKYLKQNYDMFGSWDLAIAAYQAGPGTVQQAGNQIPNSTDGITTTPDYVAKIMGLAGPVTDQAPVSPMPVDQTTGESVTAAGGDAPTTVRPPNGTGTVSPMTTPSGEMTGISQGGSTQQGDGLGIYAGPDADESWVTVLSPNGGVNGDYKENVCGDRYGEYGCCDGGDCSYASTANLLDPRSANQTVHPGYDIALENGTTFYAPVGGVVLGTKTNAGGPGCAAPDTKGINECSWAYDNGLVIGGITDSEGEEIYINFDHTSPDESLVGQTIQPGQPLGVGLDKGHVHVESHGYCPDSGMMVVLDPSLVMGGYYNSHSVCEGITR